MSDYMTNGIVSDANVEDALKALPIRTEEFAAAKAERVYLDEMRKSLKAILMKESSESSAAAQERDAYAHERYQDHLKQIRQAVLEEETARGKMKRCEHAIEIWRTQSANRRSA